MLDPSLDAHNWGQRQKNEEKKFGVGGLLLFFENLGPPQANNNFTTNILQY
jgi:hypothetical protein